MGWLLSVELSLPWLLRLLNIPTFVKFNLYTVGGQGICGKAECTRQGTAQRGWPWSLPIICNAGFHAQNFHKIGAWV
jgi:hypothetical protein